MRLCVNVASSLERSAASSRKPFAGWRSRNRGRSLSSKLKSTSATRFSWWSCLRLIAKFTARVLAPLPPLAPRNATTFPPLALLCPPRSLRRSFSRLTAASNSFRLIGWGRNSLIPMRNASSMTWESVLAVVKKISAAGFFSRSPFIEARVRSGFSSSSSTQTISTVVGPPDSLMRNAR